MRAKVRRVKKRRRRKSLAERRQYDFGADQPRSTEHWDFFRDGLSPSYINTFLRCRQQFRLSTCCALGVDKYNFSKEYGNVWHWLHEQWVSRKMSSIMKELKRYHKEEFLPKWPTLSAGQRKEQDLAYTMTMALWPVYVSEYREDKGREWTLFESALSVAYKFDKSGEHKVNRSSTWLRGVLDGGFLKRKGLWLHEMKTKGRYNDDQIRSVIHLDLQTMVYCTMLQAWMGKEPRGFEYDIVRCPGSKPLVSKGETLMGYQRRLGVEAEKNPKHFFCRIEVKLREGDLKMWQEAVLDPILCDIRDWSLHVGRHYPNPEALQPRNWTSEFLNYMSQGDDLGLVHKAPFSHHE